MTFPKSLTIPFPPATISSFSTEWSKRRRNIVCGYYMWNLKKKKKMIQMNLPILNFKRLIMTEWELVSCSPLLIFRESVSAG